LLFSLLLRPARSTLFPSTTLFRSDDSKNIRFPRSNPLVILRKFLPSLPHPSRPCPTLRTTPSHSPLPARFSLLPRRPAVSGTCARSSGNERDRLGVRARVRKVPGKCTPPSGMCAQRAARSRPTPRSPWIAEKTPAHGGREEPCRRPIEPISGHQDGLRALPGRKHST